MDADEGARAGEALCGFGKSGGGAESVRTYLSRGERDEACAGPHSAVRIEVGSGERNPRRYALAAGTAAGRSRGVGTGGRRVDDTAKDERAGNAGVFEALSRPALYVGRDFKL